jgi:ABC-type amino acid transport substrate-binding protein
MSYRDASGKLTGFSAEIIRAICEEMNTRCEFQVSTLDRVIESLVQDEIDIAAVSLLDTPERRSKILFAKPYFRSISLWFASPGILPGHPNIRVAAVKGSAQERYAVQQNWQIVGVPTNGQLLEPLLAGVAQAAIMPMSTAFNLQKNKSFQQLKLESTVMQVPELTGQASFGVNPRKPELKQSVDEALERIKRNGVYDRINTQFLPFRIH